MKGLSKYDGESVKLIDKDGDSFVGEVCAYFEPDDNPPDFEEEAIALESPIKNGKEKYSNPVCFNANEIVSIEIT